MKFVFKVVAAAVALIALSLVLVGFAFPSRWSAERSLLVNAEPATIHELVSDFHTWPKWADAPIVAQAQFTYGGPARGQGSYRTWRDPRGIEGRMEITSEQPNHEICFSTAMGKHGETTTHGCITYETEAAGTNVVWRDAGDLPRPFGTYFKDGVERDVRARFDRGLEALKQMAEARERAQHGEPSAQPTRR